MLRKYRDRLALRRLAKQPKILFLDYLMLDEVVRRYFAKPSIPAQRLDELKAKIEGPSTPDKGIPRIQDGTESLAPVENEVRDLARLAEALLARTAPAI